MSCHWYLKTRHRNVGPITSKQLIRLAATGKIGPRHDVSPDGKSWIKACQVQGLGFGEPAATDEPGPNRRRGAVSATSNTNVRTRNSPRIEIQTRRGIAGPFTIEKLQRLIDAGKVRPNSPARREDDCGQDRGWIPAAQIPELSFAIAAPLLPEETEETLPTPASRLQARLDQRRALKAHFVAPLTIHAADAQGMELLSFSATERRPFKTLVTNGLLPDTESPIELLLYVHDDHSGVVGLIRHLANMVRYAICESGETITVGTTFANGHPAAPIAPRSALNHFLFLPPPIPADQLLRESTNARRYLWVQPISGGERDVRNSHGLTTLVAAIQAEDHRRTSPGCVFDPFREPLFSNQPAPGEFQS